MTFNLFDIMDAQFEVHLKTRPNAVPDIKPEPEEHNLWGDDEIHQLRRDMIAEKESDIKADGINALVNLDVIQEKSISDAFDNHDWEQFGRLVELFLKREARRMVDNMSDFEVWSYFHG